jgi:hypothetical protein
MLKDKKQPSLLLKQPSLLLKQPFTSETTIFTGLKTAVFATENHTILLAKKKRPYVELFWRVRMATAVGESGSRGGRKGPFF